MKDLFIYKNVPLTPEIGMALKNFRIENSTTAVSITEKFGKASSYISKLEKGDIKKIDGYFLLELCNFIASSSHGVEKFLSKLSQNFTEYSSETKIIIMNIDDLLVLHKLPSTFVSDLKKYMYEKNITISELSEKINSNEDISSFEGFSDAPLNEWVTYNNNFDHIFIKLFIPENYIDDLLNGKVESIHRVIAEGILYSAYTLGNEKDPATLSNSKLTLYKILRVRGENIVAVNDDNIESLFGGLEPDVADAIKSVTSNLKVITTVTREYGTKRIKQLSKNMGKDLGFSFAYMSIDLTGVEAKSKEKKQDFLDELKKLVNKYSSSEENSSLNIYE